MAGRSRDPGAEVRKERTVVRWTSSEMSEIRDAKERLGLQYEVDVVRTRTLKQLKLEECIGDGAENLEKARKKLGLKSTEEALWELARIQLERLSSVLEKDVAE